MENSDDYVVALGAGGYLGSVLVPDLLSLGYNVKVIDRFFFGNTLLPHPNLTLIKDDIRFFDPKLLRWDDRNGGVCIVMDLAGMSNDPSADLNPEITKAIHKGTVRAATLAKEMGVRKYIYSSSCSVYGQGEDLHLTEKSPTNPVSLYAKTKLEAEQKLLELNDPSFCVSALRNSTIYGLSPRMRFDLVVNLMTLTAWETKKIYVMGGGHQWRPLVHVKDVARAFIKTMETSEEIVGGEIFNTGSNAQNYEIINIAKMIKSLMPDTELVITPDDVDKRTYSVDFTKIKTVLGFHPEYDIEYGVKEIRDALDKGIVDPNDLRTRTVKYYQYLLDADKILSEIKLSGRVF